VKVQIQPAGSVDRARANPIEKPSRSLLLRSAAILSAIWILFPGTSSADIIAYDPFNQAVGPIADTASSGGIPPAVWPGTSPDNDWEGVSPTGSVTIQPGTLTYGPLASQGNHAQATNIYESRAVRPFVATYPSESNLWLSFLMQGTTANKNEGLSLWLNTTENIFFGHRYASWANNGYYGIKLATSLTGVQVSEARTVDTNTHFFVVHLNITGGTSTFTLYFDPDFSSLGNGSAPTGGASATLTTTNVMDFDRIRISTAGTTVLFDEFRMGDTWADVSPTTSAVPEPSSLVLSFVLLGVATVLGWRRRKPAA